MSDAAAARRAKSWSRAEDQKDNAPGRRRTRVLIKGFVGRDPRSRGDFLFECSGMNGGGRGAERQAAGVAGVHASGIARSGCVHRARASLGHFRTHARPYVCIYSARLPSRHALAVCTWRFLAIEQKQKGSDVSQNSIAGKKRSIAFRKWRQLAAICFARERSSR